MVRMIRAALAGCVVGFVACASGPPKFVGDPIRSPINILVRVSSEAAATDDFGGTAAMVETIVDGLKERGVETRLFLADDDAPPPPRIELWIQKWDAGDVSGRGAAASAVYAAPLAGAVAMLAMSGGYAVVSAAYREGDVKPVFAQRYVGSIASGDSGASASAGESIGHSVVRDVLHPFRDLPPKPSAPRQPVAK